MLYFTPSFKIVCLTADAARQQFELEAKPDGIVAAVAALLGLGETSRLHVDSSGVRLRVVSFRGEQRVYCPLSNVAATAFLRAQPIELFVIAVLFAVPALPQLLDSETRVSGIIFGAVSLMFVIAFLMAKRRVVIGVVTNAATVESLKVKASAAEVKQLTAAAEILEGLLGGHSRAAEPDPDDAIGDWGDDPPSPVPHAPVAAQPQTFTMRCTNCDSLLKMKDEWRGKQVHCPACRQKQIIPM